MKIRGQQVLDAKERLWSLSKVNAAKKAYGIDEQEQDK